ncbi:hypothetical protein [Dokdonella sp.]|uniref:hypothetical protein n=1 Tax=Dokdonella sp. TaxID=2291710 RepID=UPI003C374094
MNRSALAPLGLLALLAATAAAQAADSASGAVSLENVDFTVVDGLAFANREGLAISLSSTDFDKQKMRKDGKVDIFDRMRHSGQVVSINIDKGKPTMCVDYAFQEGDTASSGSYCETGVADAVEITRLDDNRVAGSMNWNNGKDTTIEVTFDLAIEPDGK